MLRSGALRRPGARLRATLVVVVVATLCAAPAVVAAVPASRPTVPAAATLADRVRASAAVAFAGYAESVGTLAVPDVPQLGDTASLLGDLTRLRVWHQADGTERVDQLSATGETDTYRLSGASWSWDSQTRRATLTVGSTGVRLPAPADLVPPALGRRLLNGAAPGELSLGGARRVAGHDTVALVARPADPRTLVRQVTLWVEPATGLPLAVALVARDASTVFTSSFLDLSLQAPARDTTSFTPPADAVVQQVSASDAQAAATRLSPFRLPATVAGLPRRGDIGGGAGDYGTGYAVVAVVGLELQLTRQTLDRLGALPTVTGPYGTAALLQTPVLTALIVQTPDRGYLLAGTVTRQVLEQVATDLAANPPPRIGAPPGHGRHRPPRAAA
jgi:MucB/RseB N-terminal domain